MKKDKAQLAKQARFKRRKARTRANIEGRMPRMRMSIHRSLKHISVQVIDDAKHHTVLAVTEKELSAMDKKKNKTERAALVGALLAKKVQEKKITDLVFDRSGYRYQGRVKALADAAREAGLQF